uniref:COX assembly mitochondrial protein n=1 Tax=Ascaris lumbricoides TaxID=6252 RepID=A0A0M3HV38_ASCLU
MDAKKHCFTTSSVSRHDRDSEDQAMRKELIRWAAEKQEECRQKSDAARLSWCNRNQALINIECQLQDMYMCRKLF